MLIVEYLSALNDFWYLSTKDVMKLHTGLKYSLLESIMNR